MPGKNWLHGARIANAHVSVSKSDTTDSTTELPSTVVALYVGTAGNIACRMRANSTNVTYKNIASGEYIEGNFQYVLSTNTTASDIIAVYVI